MAVSKQQKVEILAELTQKFKNAQSIGFAKSNTMSVADFGELRNALREVDATYNLAKKTLIIKAVKDALDIDIDLSMLEGQIGVVCSNSDAIAGLSKVNDAVKKYKGEKLDWAACIFEGELRGTDETKEIAGMPSRETLLGRLVGSMQSPLSALARFFDAAASDIEAQGKAKLGELTGSKEVSQKEDQAPETPAQEVPQEEAKA